MAEAAGLVLGGLGVVGVFSVCVQAFDMIQIARTQDRTLRVLATKLDNQKARFIIWGESLGLNGSEEPDRRAQHPVVARSISRSCELIYELFSDSNQLRQRYGLIEDRSGTPSSLVQSRSSDQSIWRHTFSRARVRTAQAPQSEPSTRPGRTHITRWVIKDQKGFEELVKDCRELIDDLQSLTDFRGIPERRREITTLEIESISDRQSIRLLQESSVNEETILSDAASIRAITLGVEDLGSTIDTYRTALESQSEGLAEDQVTDLAVDDSDPIAVVPQNQRVVRRQGIPDSEAATQRDLAAAQQRNNARPLLVQRHKMNVAETDLGSMFNPTVNIGPALIRRVMREVVKVFNDGIDLIPVTCKPLPESNGIYVVSSILGPPSSPYEDGIFHFLMMYTASYPWRPPVTRCMTKVYHPNIDPQGRICLDILAGEWSPTLTIYTVLLSIQQLLGYPEPNDPIVPEIASTLINDPELYARNAKMYTQRYATQVSPSDEQVQRAISSAREAARRGENNDENHMELLRQHEPESAHDTA